MQRRRAVLGDEAWDIILRQPKRLCARLAVGKQLVQFLFRNIQPERVAYQVAGRTPFLVSCLTYFRQKYGWYEQTV
jgi:hypothetical protein